MKGRTGIKELIIRDGHRQQGIPYLNLRLSDSLGCHSPSSASSIFRALARIIFSSILFSIAGR